MKNEVMEKCYKASDKIIAILDGLGYASDRKPSYENEVRDLIAIEVRRTINDVVTAFYNSVTVNSVVKTETLTEENTQVPLENKFTMDTTDDCCGENCDCE